MYRAFTFLHILSLAGVLPFTLRFRVLHNDPSAPQYQFERCRLRSKEPLKWHISFNIGYWRNTSVQSSMYCKCTAFSQMVYSVFCESLMLATYAFMNIAYMSSWTLLACSRERCWHVLVNVADMFSWKMVTCLRKRWWHAFMHVTDMSSWTLSTYPRALFWHVFIQDANMSS